MDRTDNGKGQIAKNAKSAKSGFPFKVAAVDLDGTLLCPDKTVSAANEKAIQLLRAHGCQIVMASGRRHEDILPAYHHLGLTGPVISCDGIVIKMPLTEEVWLEKRINETLAHTLIEEGHQHNLSMYYYHGESVFYARENAYTLGYQACTRSRKPIRNEYLHDLKGNRAQKVVFCDHPERIAALKAVFHDRYSGQLQVIETEPGYLEFMPLATSKFTALQALSDKLGFHTDEALAFGDNWNDVEILSSVGFGVAMTVSSEAAKRAAKAISPAGDCATSFARAVELVFDKFYPSRQLLADKITNTSSDAVLALV
jgi:Cof subfamily protein (haloacid dehalogenase superfamily)